MALTATLYNFAVALNDSDRERYESLDLRLACHPSETVAFMLTRLLAYCLEHEDGIEFTDGVCAGDQCAVQVVDLTGRVTHWIEVGAPSAQRLHRGSKLAGRATVYTHRDAAKVLASLRGEPVHGAGHIDLVSFAPGFVDTLVPAVGRRNTLSLSITGGQLYLDINGEHHETAVLRQPIDA